MVERDGETWEKVVLDKDKSMICTSGKWENRRQLDDQQQHITC